MSRKIVNTAQDEVNPQWTMGGDPDAILRQEARGQRDLLDSTQLPVKGSDDPKLAEMGIVFGDPTPGDPLFREATLPKGWKKKATEHSMWSDIVDETGAVRAQVFYKAAFYDRKASICAR